MVFELTESDKEVTLTIGAAPHTHSITVKGPMIAEDDSLRRQVELDLAPQDRVPLGEP